MSQGNSCRGYCVLAGDPPVNRRLAAVNKASCPFRWNYFIFLILTVPCLCFAPTPSIQILRCGRRLSAEGWARFHPQIFAAFERFAPFPTRRLLEAARDSFLRMTAWDKKQFVKQKLAAQIQADPELKGEEDAFTNTVHGCPASRGASCGGQDGTTNSPCCPPCFSGGDLGIMRLQTYPNVKGVLDERAAWSKTDQFSVSAMCSSSFRGSLLIIENFTGNIISRVIRNPSPPYMAGKDPSSPADPPYDLLNNVVNRNFDAIFGGAAYLSASVGDANDPRLAYTAVERKDGCRFHGGVLLLMDGQNILAAAPRNLQTPLPIDIFERGTIYPRYIDLLETILNGVASPDECKKRPPNETYEVYNEVFFCPKIQDKKSGITTSVEIDAIFLLVPELTNDPVGLLRDLQVTCPTFVKISELYRLPLVLIKAS